jgi:hypothetical protein
MRARVVDRPDLAVARIRRRRVLGGLMNEYERVTRGITNSVYSTSLGEANPLDRGRLNEPRETGPAWTRARHII